MDTASTQYHLTKSGIRPESHGWYRDGAPEVILELQVVVFAIANRAFVEGRRSSRFAVATGNYAGEKGKEKEGIDR